jgi:hypothetical protein
LRWTIGTAMGVAVVTSFFPGAWAPLAVTLVPLVILPERRGSRLRGVVLSAGVAFVSAILAFPVVVQVVGAGGIPGVDAAGSPSFDQLLRLSPGPAPGSGVAAFFLPLAGLLSFVVVGDSALRWAGHGLATAAMAIPLAWLAGTGYLPTAAGNPPGFLAAAALALSLLVGLATGTLPSAVRRTAFGARQLAGAVLGALLFLGLAVQSLSAIGGGWAVGEERFPPAWPVVSSSQPPGAFRVLWLGAADQARFPPPGGSPDGVVEAAGNRIAYGITGRAGRSVLRIGVPSHGPAFQRLERVLTAVLSGEVRHGGGLLGNMGIRFVVAGEGDLPRAVVERLGAQVDLDVEQRAGGLSVYRSARPFPVGAVIPGEVAPAAARSGSLLAPIHVDPATATPLSGRGGERQGTIGEPGLVMVPDGFDPAWRVVHDGTSSSPFPAFGWAIGFAAEAGEVSVRYGDQVLWTVQIAVLLVVWAAALWLVRRTPVPQPRPRRATVATAPPEAVPAVASRLSRT